MKRSELRELRKVHTRGMYDVTFSDGSPEAVFPSWQQAYKFAREEVAKRPSGFNDPLVKATVTSYRPDGRFGILAEFSIPEPNGEIVRDY